MNLTYFMEKSVDPDQVVQTSHPKSQVEHSTAVLLDCSKYIYSYKQLTEITQC